MKGIRLRGPFSTSKSFAAGAMSTHGEFKVTFLGKCRAETGRLTKGNMNERVEFIEDLLLAHALFGNNPFPC